ncbi:MAG: hypothetical protein AAF138_02165 [Planctomycetota bacterium]
MRRATPLHAPGGLPGGPEEPIPVEGLTPDDVATNARQRILAREGRQAGPTPRAQTAPDSLPDDPPIPGDSTPMIRSFDQSLGGARHEDSWTRTPNTTGAGAIHVKSFHCKMSSEALSYLDQQVNEWLDAHPQYEVKFVSTGQGEWIGKTKETHLIVQVWV